MFGFIDECVNGGLFAAAAAGVGAAVMWWSVMRGPRVLWRAVQRAAGRGGAGGRAEGMRRFRIGRNECV